MRKSCSYIILTICIFSSCTSRPLRIARQTLHEADSLRAAGVQFDDSTGIAHAAATLGTWYNRTYYTSDYARANYYYGRLLREHGNQPAAMQCFIRASHTNPDTPLSKRIGLPWRQPTTDDYNLLGRIYSNIGSMCHIAGDYALSYDIYDMSSRQFQKANNLTAYYYALNDMAVELAEQNKKEETLTQLYQIEISCHDSSVLAFINLTKAEMYLNLEQYDSAIYYANQELLFYPKEPAGITIKAQSFSLLNVKDSSLYYAKCIINDDTTLENRSNAYYILQHDDTTITTDSINQLAADRTDIKDLLDLYHRNYANALLIFRQDLSRKPDYRTVLLRVGTCVIIIGILALLLVGIIKRWQVRIHAGIKHEELRVQEYARHAQSEIIQTTQAEKNKQFLLKTEQKQLQNQNRVLLEKNTEYLEQCLKRIEKDCAALRAMPNFKKVISWNNLSDMSAYADKQFYLLATKLRSNSISLTEMELRLCILVFIGFRLKQIADILPYAYSGVGKLKDTTAKKLGTTGKNLRNFLLETAIGMKLADS